MEWTVSLVTLTLSLAIGWLVIWSAVRSALKRHDVWRAEGGLERLLDKRTEERQYKATVASMYANERNTE